MPSSRGFSLIETLVAVVIAAIAALALLQAVSTSSHSTARAVETFDDSLIKAVLIGAVSDNSTIDTVDTDDMLQERYSIDNADILATLKGYSFRVERSPAESVDPLMSSEVHTIAGTSLPSYTLSLQKIKISNKEGSKTFFHIYGGSL